MYINVTVHTTRALIHAVLVVINFKFIIYY